MASALTETIRVRRRVQYWHTECRADYARSMANADKSMLGILQEARGEIGKAARRGK